MTSPYYMNPFEEKYQSLQEVEQEYQRILKMMKQTPIIQKSVLSVLPDDSDEEKEEIPETQEEEIEVLKKFNMWKDFKKYVKLYNTAEIGDTIEFMYDGKNIEYEVVNITKPDKDDIFNRQWLTVKAITKEEIGKLFGLEKQKIKVSVSYFGFDKPKIHFTRAESKKVVKRERQTVYRSPITHTNLDKMTLFKEIQEEEE